jgi:hypothetical protein
MMPGHSQPVMMPVAAGSVTDTPTGLVIAKTGPILTAGVAVDNKDVNTREEDDGSVFLAPGAHDHASEKPTTSFMDKWKNFGGSSLAVSLIVHGVLALVAGAIVFVTVLPEPKVDFLPGGGSAAGEKASSDMKQKVANKRRKTIAKSVPKTRLVSTSSTSSIVLPDSPTDMLDVPDAASTLGEGSLGSGGFGKGGAGGGFGTGFGIGGQAGMVALPPTMRARCSTSERLLKLKQNGGTAECEAAISRALEWLKTKQNRDGSWGPQAEGAMTGFALLCYLGRCETPESPFYGENVLKGIMYLLELGSKNPYGMFSENIMEHAAAYEHGIATYALGEMYTLSRLGSKALPGMREAFEKGVKLIIENQNAQGSWNYGGDKHGSKTAYYRDGKGEDLSLAGWQYQALKAAKNTGLKVPGLHEAIAKTVTYLESKQTKDGGIGKMDRDAHYNQWNLTGAGALGLQTLAKGKTKTIDKAIAFLKSFIMAEPLDWNKNCNLYAWYYYTQTFFQKGGEEWKFYNEMCLPQLLNNQNADGSWKPERSSDRAVGNSYGGIYKTALCTLQLEVYYRYLKVGDREEESFFDK